MIYLYRVEVKIGSVWSTAMVTKDHKAAYQRARHLRGHEGHVARVKIVRAS